MSLAPNDPRHGTHTGYTNHRCRCDACREAARTYRQEHDYRTYHREWSHRVGRSKPMADYLADVEPAHGTEARYTSNRFRCRCAACRAAASEAKRRRREQSRVPCSHGCGTLVDSINRATPDKPPECRPCAMRRVNRARRKTAA